MFVAFLIIATLLSYMLLIRIDMIKNLINTEEDIGCAIMCILLVVTVIGSIIFSIIFND